MNLRILKKLSKRAAPLLPLLGDTRKQFKAGKCDAFIKTGGHDRKHWERFSAPYPDERDLKYMPKHGKQWVVLRQPDYALKGTIMVGAMQGHYELEWEEETAWDSLVDLVRWHFTDYIDEGDDVRIAPTRDLDTPTKILKAAHDILSKETP